MSTKGGPASPTVRATLAPCTAAAATTAPSTAAPVASPTGLCDCSDTSTTRAGATSGEGVAVGEGGAPAPTREAEPLGVPVGVGKLEGVSDG